LSQLFSQLFFPIIIVVLWYLWVFLQVSNYIFEPVIFSTIFPYYYSCFVVSLGFPSGFQLYI